MQEYDSNKRFSVPEGARLFQDMYDNVINDKWAFVVVWGQQRLGKSTLALWIAYYLWRLLDPNLTENELWERVYGATVFNLSQLMYKMRDPTQPRTWDLKHQHNRVPIFIWDDFGAHSNKAVTQHEVAWDYFKGGFDVLGTKFGVIVITLTTPEQPTSQIEHKYTHEVIITARGQYKYDAVEWQQDYKGWTAKHSKAWQQEHTFAEIPWVRFSPYDQLRVTLADEVLERIDDAMAERTPSLLKRLTKDDMAVLNAIVENGPLNGYQRGKWFTGENKKTEVRLKAHQLVTAVPHGTDWYLDITPFGTDVFNEWKKQQQAEDKQ